MSKQGGEPVSPAAGEGAPVDTAHDRAELEALAAVQAESEVAAEAAAVAAAPAEPEISTAELLALPMQVAFSIAAPNWNITGTECQNMAEAWAPVIDKYMPGGLNRFGPEMAAAMVTLAILAPRVLAGKPAREPKPKPAPVDADPVAA